MGNRWDTARTEAFSDGVFAIVPRVAAIGYLVVAISNRIRVRRDERSAALAVAKGSR
jgi:hypothetical protein